MPARKMTFSLPEEVASRFLRIVPPTKRSEYVSEALTRKMRERDEIFEAACDALEGDPDLDLLAREMDALNDDPLVDGPYEEIARVSKAG